MEERIPLLRGKVGSEAKGMEKRLHVLSQEWEAGRPLSKDHTPSEVQMAIVITMAGDDDRCASLLGNVRIVSRAVLRKPAPVVVLQFPSHSILRNPAPIFVLHCPSYSMLRKPAPVLVLQGPPHSIYMFCGRRRHSTTDLCRSERLTCSMLLIESGALSFVLQYSLSFLLTPKSWYRRY